MGDDPLCGYDHKARMMGYLVGDRLDTVMSVLGDEITSPRAIVAIENQVLSAADNQTIDFGNFGSPQFAESRRKFTE